MPSLTVSSVARSTQQWLRERPLAALALAFLMALFVYFFVFLNLFPDPVHGVRSVARWSWEVWTPKNNYEHAKLIPLITLFLIWHARDKLKAAPLGSSRWGWLFIAAGAFLFFAGARTLQPRLSLIALPALIFGAVLVVLGKSVARVLLFPIAFLLFMVPLNFLTQATANLQFMETGVAATVCNFIGLSVYKVGTTISAVNESFRFQVDEGCSGIRSLMAISMLSAIYAHLTQDRIWKKVVIFAASIVFAIIGNAGRLVSIMVVARWFGQDLAGGPYHEISGFLSFPFAIGAMLLLGKLLNLKPRQDKSPVVANESLSI